MHKFIAPCLLLRFDGLRDGRFVSGFHDEPVLAPAVENTFAIHPRVTLHERCDCRLNHSIQELISVSDTGKRASISVIGNFAKEVKELLTETAIACDGESGE